MPKLREGVKPRVQVTIRLSEEALAKLAEMAGDGGTSDSLCIEHLIRKAHREHEKCHWPATYAPQTAPELETVKPDGV